MGVKELEARRIGYDTVHIMWAVSPMVYDQVYQIERSIGEGDYRIIARTKSTSYIDYNKILRKGIASYRITADDVSIDVKEDKAGDGYLYEVVSNYNHVFKNGKAGIKVYVYCLTKDNEPCTECYDKELRKRIKRNCVTCDGSGYIRGYKGPIETYISVMGGQKRVGTDFHGGGPSSKIMQAWMSNYPLINPGDIFIISKTERYIVKNDPQRTDMVDINNRPFTVKQVFILEKVDQSHQANKLSPETFSAVEIIEHKEPVVDIIPMKPKEDEATTTVEDTYQLTVNVNDDEEAIVEGATVTIDGYSTQQTNSQGQAFFDLPDGDYTGTINKVGYDTYNIINLTIDGAASIYNGQLAPADFTLDLNIVPEEGDGSVMVHLNGGAGVQHFTSVVLNITYKASLMLVAIEGDNYEFSKWTGHIGNTDMSTTFNMPAESIVVNSEFREK